MSSPAHPFLPQWSIKLHSGSGEALQQYRANLTAIAVHLERLADHGEVYWVLQGKAAKRRGLGGLAQTTESRWGGTGARGRLVSQRASLAADPVNEEALSDSRKMITNQQLELYNEAAAEVLKASRADGRSRVKLLAASRQAAMETIAQSDDGLHLPESTRNVVGLTVPDVLLSSAAQWRWRYSLRLRLRAPRCS